MDSKLKEAVKTLCEALSEDKSEGSYYYSWQANIAMAFKDEYDRDAALPELKDIHHIANQAAKNFLDTLIKL